MIAFTLVFLLAAEAPLQCTKTDALCWAQSYEQERSRVGLLQSGYDAAKRLAATNDERAETWKKTAMENAPKPPSILTSPIFWLGVGLLAGAAATVAVTYAVNQPR